MEKQNDLLMDSSILYRSTQKYYDKMLQNLELTYAQLPILIQIYENEGISLQEIAHIGGYDKGTVTKNVQKLNSLGYITIMPNLKDKRAKELYTTALAKKHISEIYGIRWNWWHHITQDLTQEEIKVFSKFYRTMSNHARTYADLGQLDLQFYMFKPLSLTEYDNHLSCCLYTGGCNFKCPHCINPNLVFLKADTYPVSNDYLKKYLEGNRNKLDGVYISGGEPLMNENIFPFLAYLKKLDYKVKVHTNGMFSNHLYKAIIEHLVDYISLDIKNCPSKYSISCGVQDIDLSSVKESIRILKENHVDYDVFLRIHKDEMDYKSMVELADFLVGVKKVVIVPYSYPLQNYSFDPLKEEMLEYCEILKKKIDLVELRGVEYD